MLNKNDRFTALVPVAPGPVNYPVQRLRIVYDLSYDYMSRIVYEKKGDSYIFPTSDELIENLRHNDPAINRYQMNGYYAAYQDASTDRKTALGILFKNMAQTIPEASYDPMVTKDMQLAVTQAQAMLQYNEEAGRQIMLTGYTLNLYAVAGKIDPDILIRAYSINDLLIDLVERTPKAIPCLRERFRRVGDEIAYSDLLYSVALQLNEPAAEDIAIQVFNKVKTEEAATEQVVGPIIEITSQIMDDVESGRTKRPMRLMQYMTYLNVVIRRWPEYRPMIEPIAARALSFGQKNGLYRLTEHAEIMYLNVACMQQTQKAKSPPGPE